MTRRTDETLSRAIGKAIANKRQLAGFTQAKAADSCYVLCIHNLLGVINFSSS